MFNSSILEVAIGISFVFILVSTLCSAIREGIESMLKTRAAYLEYAIRELLHDRLGVGLAKSFFTHPLIHGLYQGDYEVKHAGQKPKLWHGGGHMPSYIPSKSFALALIDLAARGPATDAASSDPALPAICFESLRASVSNLQNPAVQRALLAAIDSAQGDLEQVRDNLAAWYDGAMDRVSGWYKRSTQWLIFVIALFVVGALNVNTITIADFLYRNETVRSTMVATAAHAGSEMNYGKASENLDQLRLPIGWSGGWGSPKTFTEQSAHERQTFALWNDLFAPILGLLITTFAATLGAPFWFDVLNRVMVIRATVKPHEKSPEEGSEDRQPAGARSEAPRPRVVAFSEPTFAQLPAAATTSLQPENDVDGCDARIEDITPDEELPPAKGGVS